MHMDLKTHRRQAGRDLVVEVQGVRQQTFRVAPVCLAGSTFAGTGPSERAPGHGEGSRV